jgi:hypothetical protein
MKTKQGKEISVGDMVGYIQPRESNLSWFKVTKVGSEEVEVYHPTYDYNFGVEIEMIEQHKKAEEKDDE